LGPPAALFFYVGRIKNPVLLLTFVLAELQSDEKKTEDINKLYWTIRKKQLYRYTHARYNNDNSADIKTRKLQYIGSGKLPPNQGCQILLGTIYQIGGKYTKLSLHN
jgi:hypothetical protein